MRGRGLIVFLLLAGALSTGAVARPADGRSPGCGAQPPKDAPEVVVVDGRPRNVITVVPEGYDANTAHALVVGFHGRTNSNDRARRYFDLEDGRSDTIFVYPSGLEGDDGAYSWSDPGDSDATLRDYRLFDAIVASISERYCVDFKQVFAVGHSLGAWFANSLGCARGDVLRAVATVAGGTAAPSSCRGQTAAMLVHNPKDRLVDIEHGRAARDLFVANNAATPAGKEAVGRYVCQRFDDHERAHPVLWCPHDASHTGSERYYPHQWPSGTGEAMMSFFDSLPPHTDTGRLEKSIAREQSTHQKRSTP